MDTSEFYLRTHLLGHNINLVQRNSRTDIAKYAFSSIVVHHWNSLPGKLQNMNNLYSFKKGLEKYLNIVRYGGTSANREILVPLIGSLFQKLFLRTSKIVLTFN